MKPLSVFRISVYVTHCEILPFIKHTQLTLDEDRASELQWLAVAIAILGIDPEEVSSTLDEVGHTAGCAIDG